MGINIRGRSFLTLLDFTPEEINYLLDLSAEFKRMKNNGVEHKWLTDKQVVLLFEKTSTRTRCAFEVGARDLGMGVTFLDPGSSQMGKKESLADTAKVLGRMYDGIEYRGFKQSVVEDLARYSGVPVWNGLTDMFHPTQMLADIMTAREEFGDLRGRKLTFFGDARNNVANSLMVVSAKLGMHFCACGPKDLMPAPELVEKCQAVAAETGAVLEFTDDVKKGAENCDIVYTDIWVSMYLGLHGRARRDLGRAYQAPAALPGEQGTDGHGQAHRHLPALPALLPRPGDHRWSGHLQEVRSARHGSHRRRVPGQAGSPVQRG